MSRQPDETEDQILTACYAYRQDESQNISSVARQFNVPYDRLRRRIKGHKSRHARRPVKHLLNEIQETAILKFVMHLSKIGDPPTAEHIVGYANSALRRNHEDPKRQPPKVGKMWAYQFIKQMPPRCRDGYQKALDARRARDQADEIEGWYELFEKYLIDHQIHPSDLYDFGEFGFVEGQGRREGDVFQFTDKAPPVCPRGLVTVLECVSADGSRIPPYIILPGKKPSENWSKRVSKPGDWLTVKSETGRVTDVLAYQWIHYFDEHSRERQVGKKRMVLVNPRKTYLTYQFIKFCEDNNIILYRLPREIACIAQPLDGKPLQRYKHFYAEAVNEPTTTTATTRPRTQKFTNEDFLTALPRIRNNALDPDTIRSAFQERSIHPFNPTPVVQELRRVHEEKAPEILTDNDDNDDDDDDDADDDEPRAERNRTPSRSPSPTIPSELAPTPKSRRQMRRMILKLRRVMDTHSPFEFVDSPWYFDCIKKIMRSNEITDIISGLYEEDLERMRREEEEEGAEGEGGE